MHDSVPPPVELRLLRSLIVVAEAGGVSAAADRLRIAQPSLSRQLRLLEKQLGLPLFERAGRRLRVAPAAEPVVEAARRALAAADHVAHVAGQVSRGDLGRITVGVLPGASPVLIADALAAFGAKHPQVEAGLAEFTDDEQFRALREGRAEITLSRIAPPPSDLAHQVLLSEPLCLVVSARHRLADVGRAAFADLQGERLVFFSRSMQPVGHGWLAEQLSSAGVASRIQEATLSTLFATVAAGTAVSVLVRSYETLLSPSGVRFLPLAGGAVDLVMQWHPDRLSPAGEAFRAELLRAARAHGHRPG